ncbi:hypothetical protein I4U23_019317 [Adineta vaga]|nr:hypothetical protein I4U23_019317 [Adineta vaga]
MTDTRRLNKALWTNMTRLKLLTKPDAHVKFILEKSPFDDDDNDDDNQAFIEKDEYLIIGRIYPNSNIYKEGSYRIELKLTSKYPIEPPEVRFLTRIYHPNVDQNGIFCYHLLSNSSRWKLNRETTLVELIRSIVKHLDEPDPDYAVTLEIGKEYMNNRAEFNRKALETMKKYSLPRN